MKNVRAESSTYPLPVPPAVVTQDQTLAPIQPQVAQHADMIERNRLNRLATLPQRVRDAKDKVQEVKERLQSGIDEQARCDQDLKDLKVEIDRLQSGPLTSSAGRTLSGNYEKIRAIKVRREEAIRFSGRMKSLLAQAEASLAEFPYNDLAEYLEIVKQQDASRQVGKQFKK